MKLLTVNTGVFAVPTSRGGTENHVYYLSRSLSKQEIEIDLVSDVGENAEFGNINVHPINLPEFFLFDKGFKGYMLRHAVGGLYAFNKARELLNSNHYDIIHVHGRLTSLFLSLFKNNIPLVFTLHDDLPSRKQPHYYTYKLSYKVFQQTVAKRASHVIVYHTKLKNYLTNLSIDPNKISVIPNGVDIDLFMMNKKERSENCLIFVGFLTKRKGVNYLLEAVSKIGNIRLIIVGDGPEKKSLKLLANALNISENVTFVGSIGHHELSNYYSQASIFILPSFSEAFPQVVLQAMSCGLATIATNISGLPEVITAGYNGFLVEPANVEQLREKIRILAHNPNLSKQIGKNARKIVEERYRWDIIAKQTIRVYKKVLEENY